MKTKAIISALGASLMVLGLSIAPAYAGEVVNGPKSCVEGAVFVRGLTTHTPTYFVWNGWQKQERKFPDSKGFYKENTYYSSFPASTRSGVVSTGDVKWAISNCAD